jgi:hypothetical protein
MNLLRAKFTRYKLVLWCTLKRGWDTFIPPFGEAVHSSSDVDGPTLFADLNLRQRLIILRASTCCESSTEIWTRDTEEFVRVPDLFAELEEGLKQLQMCDTMIRRNGDGGPERRPLKEMISKPEFKSSELKIPLLLESGSAAQVER